MQVLLTIFAGGVGVALLSFFTNNWIKSREQDIDMSKRKMDAILEMMPFYGQLAMIF